MSEGKKCQCEECAKGKKCPCEGCTEARRGGPLLKGRCMMPQLDVHLIKKAADPLGVIRISIGGGHDTGGVYCVYRGSKESAIECLNLALLAMEAMASQLGPELEPDMQPEDGKRYS